MGSVPCEELVANERCGFTSGSERIRTGMRRNDEVARTEGDRAITFPKLQGKMHFHIHTYMQNLAQKLRRQAPMRLASTRVSLVCSASF